MDLPTKDCNCKSGSNKKTMKIDGKLATVGSTPKWTRLHLFLKAQTTLASDMDHLMVSDGDMIPARGI